MLRRALVSFFVAYHEAGHRVASYRLFPDRVRGRVTILPSGETAGHCFEEGSWGHDRPSMEAQVVMMYAGAAAELLLDASRTEEVRAGARSDDAVAEELLGGIGLELAPSLRRRATAFVTEHWSEIDAVAKELLRRRVLTGTEAELVCDAAGGGPDAADAAQRLETYRVLRKASRAPIVALDDGARSGCLAETAHLAPTVPQVVQHRQGIPAVLREEVREDPVRRLVQALSERVEQRAQPPRRDRRERGGDRERARHDAGPATRPCDHRHGRPLAPRVHDGEGRSSSARSRPRRCRGRGSSRAMSTSRRRTGRADPRTVIGVTANGGGLRNPRSHPRIQPPGAASSRCHGPPRRNSSISGPGDVASVGDETLRRPPRAPAAHPEEP